VRNTSRELTFSGTILGPHLSCAIVNGPRICARHAPPALGSITAGGPPKCVFAICWESNGLWRLVGLPDGSARNIRVADSDNNQAPKLPAQ
jgi:hypothetical protein